MPDLSADVLAGLAGLTTALDDPDVDVATSVKALSITVLSAVPSYLGLSLQIDTHGQRITIPTVEAGLVDADIATSLSLSLGDTPFVKITLTLFARNSGAFVDLAADIGWLTGDAAVDFVFDRHRAVPVEAVAGLERISVINQAIGVLMAGGYTAESAVAALDGLAVDGEVDRHGAAGAVLDALEQDGRSA